MAADIRLRVDFFGSHKTLKLHRQGGAEAVLALIHLWTFAAANRRDGVLSGMSDEEIEIAAGWMDTKLQLVPMLVDCKFLDRHGKGKSYSLHNWIERQPWISGAQERSERAREAGLKSGISRRKKGTQNEPTVGNRLNSSLLFSSPEEEDLVKPLLSKDQEDSQRSLKSACILDKPRARKDDKNQDLPETGQKPPRNIQNGEGKPAATAFSEASRTQEAAPPEITPQNGSGAFLDPLTTRLVGHREKLGIVGSVDSGWNRQWDELRKRLRTPGSGTDPDAVEAELEGMVDAVFNPLAPKKGVRFWAGMLLYGPAKFVAQQEHFVRWREDAREWYANQNPAKRVSRAERLYGKAGVTDGESN